MTTQRTNAVMAIETSGFSRGRYGTQKDCSTCEHEKTNLTCGHPQSHLKAWESMIYPKCYSSSGAKKRGKDV